MTDDVDEEDTIGVATMLVLDKEVTKGELGDWAAEDETPRLLLDEELGSAGDDEDAVKELEVTLVGRELLCILLDAATLLAATVFENMLALLEGCVWSTNSIVGA